MLSVGDEAAVDRAYLSWANSTHDDGDGNGDGAPIAKVVAQLACRNDHDYIGMDLVVRYAQSASIVHSEYNNHTEKMYTERRLSTTLDAILHLFARLLVGVLVKVQRGSDIAKI